MTRREAETLESLELLVEMETSLRLKPFQVILLAQFESYAPLYFKMTF